MYHGIPKLKLNSIVEFRFQLERVPNANKIMTKNWRGHPRQLFFGNLMFSRRNFIVQICTHHKSNKPKVKKFNNKVRIRFLLRGVAKLKKNKDAKWKSLVF